MIGIVGGGLSGLFLLHALQARGVDAVLLEAGDQVGGVARTRVRGSHVLDLGPQRFRATPELHRLLDELGLDSELVPAASGLPLLIWRNGRLRRAPNSWRAGLTTDLLSWRSKLRVPLEVLGAPPLADETVGAFLRRRLGNEAYLALAGPLLGGLYASHPERMLARHSLARILQQGGRNGRPSRSLVRTLLRVTGGAEGGAYGLSGGIGRLSEALLEANSARVRMGAPVEVLRTTADGGYRLEGPWGELSVDQVVLATPAAAAARLLAGVDPDAGERLARLRTNPLAVIHLESEGELPAAGVKLALDEPGPVRGITANGALLGRTGLYTAFLGGMGREDVLEADDAELMAVAEAEFRRLLGWEARALHLHRTAIPAWDLTWTALEGLTLPRGVHLCSGFHSRPGIPGRLAEAEELARKLAQGSSRARSPSQSTPGHGELDQSPAHRAGV